MNVLRWIVTAWISAGGMAGTARGAAELGPAEVTCNGQAAASSSATEFGFFLFALDTGPQVAAMPRREACVVDVRRGEEAAVAIPVKNYAGPLTVAVRAVARGEVESEVSLALDGQDAWQKLAPGGAVELRAAGTVGAKGSRLVLKARGLTEASTAVEWRGVRIEAGGPARAVPMAVAAGDAQRCAPRELPPLRPSIEQAMIEWDWRMQDGIGSERAGVSYVRAVERTLDRGDRLIADLAGGGAAVGELAARWAVLRRERPAEGDEAAWEELWRRVHALRREIVLANPLAKTGPLVFAKQAPSVFSHQLTQYQGSCARPGGGIFVLDEPGRSMRCRPLAAGQLPPGSCQSPEVSYDGRRVLFSYCYAPFTPVNREQTLDRFYHLYEMEADGSKLRQLTHEGFDDLAGRYLPDGKIVFVSTRRQGYHRCGRGPCPTHTLALCNADGSDARTISYHETHEWDPAVLGDGRILYTRWDYVDRHAVHYQQLWSVRADGSDVRVYYGNNTLNPVGVWEARPIPGSNRVMATAGAHHAMTAGSIILLDTTRGVDGMGPITRLTPDALFPESEAPVRRLGPGTWHAPYALASPPAVPEEQVRWPGHCYRTPLPLSEKYFLASYSFDSLIGEPDANPCNQFGIYLVDAMGNKELLYRDLNISSLWSMPLRARPKPAALPELAEASEPAEGVFFVQNVYQSWPALPRESVKRLRIVQVLPKSTWHANDPMVGLANASPGKQVLGTVPVEADGSALFRAPARVPLALQALDASGQAVQVMRSVTYLQPGERVSCVGCHEPRMQAPAPRAAALALARDPSAIVPGPEGSKPLCYPILVQPVLDKHCVSCHGTAKVEGGVRLTGEPEGHFTRSYNALAPRVPYAEWGKPGDFRVANSEPMTRPEFFGARKSGLMQLVRDGHYGVKLGAEEFERLATWADANALFYGSFEPADQARQLRGERIAGPRVQ